MAIGLTIGLALFILTAFTLVLAGPALAETVARAAGLGAVFTWAWKILQWPVAFALICVGMGVIYYVGPDADQDWVWVTPGALLATTLWLVASLIFRVYVVSFADYQATYGTLGGVVVLLLWMYMTGLAIVAGAETNAEIEHASPWGKEPGEKTPGVRKKIGAAAERAYRERSHALRPVRVLPNSAPAVPPASIAAASVSDWLVSMALRCMWPRLRRRE